MSKERQAERALAKAEMDYNAQRGRELRARREARSDASRLELPNDSEIEAALEMISVLMQRRVRLFRPKEIAGAIGIAQRCAVCRADFCSPIDRTIAELDWRKALAVRVRLEYAAHDCRPVEDSLTHLTNAEMDELLAQTERDLERIATRCQEYRAAFAAMLEAEQRGRNR